MGRFIDLTGMQFGRLTVISRSEKTDSSGNVHWNCICDCGNKTVTSGVNLKNGHSQSCGCLCKERTQIANSKHNMRHSQIYGVWCDVKKRCFNSKHKFFSRYGGRGISIYPAWIDNFQAFYDYVSQLEHFGEKGYSLDRIDNNGNYAHGNLRWANQKSQCRNKRNNHLVEYNGVKMTLAEISNLSGIPYKTLWNRFKHGDIGEYLFRPVKH